jgi:hypothetical protein
MPAKSTLLDVFAVIQTKKVVHASHPSQALKSDYVAPQADDEDVLQCVGKACLSEDGNLVIQLQAIPLSGRLILHLPS